MASMRFIRGRVMSLARLIATPIPIKTVTRGQEVFIREKFAENGVLIGVIASKEPGVEAEEFYIARNGEFLRLSRRRDDGPRGEIHHLRTITRITQADAIDQVGAEMACTRVLELIRQRVTNAASRLQALKDAEREFVEHHARPQTVVYNIPPQIEIEEAEEVLLFAEVLPHVV